MKPKLALALGLGLLLAACADDPAGTAAGPWPLYTLGPGAAWDNHPLPSAVRFGDGPVTLDDMPNPEALPVVDEIRRMVSAAGQPASLNGGLMLPFAAAPNRASWPTDPAATTAADSPLQLVALDGSGQRVPLRWRWYGRAGTYHPPHTLRVAPDIGFTLAANSRWALVIRDGAGVERSPQMAELLAGGRPAGLDDTGAAAFAAMRDALADAGIAADELAFAHPFATGDPAADLRAVIAATVDGVAVPRLAGLRRTRDHADFCLLEGTVRMPQYQRGTPGYLREGGEWVFDGAGRLVWQRDEDLPVAVVIPKGTMPAAGWPLVVYVHGTSGTSVQVIDRGPTPPGPGEEMGQDLGHLTTANKGPGYVLARRGVASAGTALPINPQRVPSALGWGMYNFFHPLALRDNFRQGVLEQALFLRALRAARLDPGLCPGSDAGAAGDGRLRFRSDRAGMMGQSLGAIIVGLWAPVEPLVGAAVPSGAGGHYAVMLNVSTIIPGELLLRFLTRLNDNETPDLLHPLGLVLGLAFDTIDPVALAERVARAPLDDVPAKHVFTPAGYFDGFFMPDSIRALYGPLGVNLAGDVVHDSLPATLARWGRERLDYPASGNLDTPDGVRTAITTQWREDGVLDGHHVSFQLDGPKHQYSCFFRTYFDDDLPTIPAPVTAEAPCHP